MRLHSDGDLCECCAFPFPSLVSVNVLPLGTQDTARIACGEDG